MSNERDVQTELLREILKWIKLGAFPQARSMLTTILDTDKKKLAYQLSDGSRGLAEIAKAIQIKRLATISDYWKSWEKQNIGRKVRSRGGERFVRDFDLEELGIEFHGTDAAIVEPQKNDSTFTEDTASTEPKKEMDFLEKNKGEKQNV